MKAQKSIVIAVDKPKSIDGGILDTMFGSSQAISDAVSKFWDMGLATKAELGKVIQTNTAYNVEILY